MALVTLVEPSEEPVSLAQLKSHLRIDADDTSNDEDVTALGISAREWAEKFCRSRFVTQQVKYTLDGFPCLNPNAARSTVGPYSNAFLLYLNLGYLIDLPMPPVKSIDAFQYVNGSGTLATLVADTQYVADVLSRPARVAPLYGQLWPVALPVPNAVQISMTVGYGAAAAVPNMIKTQIKRLVVHWSENRIPDENDLPKGVKEALYPYRNVRL